MKLTGNPMLVNLVANSVLMFQTVTSTLLLSEVTQAGNSSALPSTSSPVPRKGSENTGELISYVLNAFDIIASL